MKSILAILLVLLIQQVVCAEDGGFEDLDEMHALLNSTNGRIAGGSAAPNTKFKEFVFLRIFRSGSVYDCGGTLITSTWVLTAAHCIVDPDGNPVVVVAYVGIHSKDKAEYVIPSLQLIPHGSYAETSADYSNDIGLIKLAQSVSESKTISYASLATQTDPPPQYVDSKMEACGFGHVDDKSTFSKTLQWTTLMGVTQSVCSTNSEIICTKWDKKVNNICGGDSGGPLKKDNKQVGIASYRLGSCKSKKPSAFVNVAMYRDWISEKIA